MTVTLPVSVAVANDYELVVAGVAKLLSRYPDRLEVRDRLVLDELVPHHAVQVALFDTYGRGDIGAGALEQLLAVPEIERVVVFSMDLPEPLVDLARQLGAHGFISKALSGDEIADAIVAVAGGEEVVARPAGDRPADDALDWPGKSHGLTERESEVLALLADGLNNTEIATALYVSLETIKSHVSSIFRKIDVRNRTQAATWMARSAGAGSGHR